jgi:glucose-1-phosphate thymidylyltransferase
MHSFILAGGFATRLYPLTLNKAKALIEYQGRPVISYIVDRIPPEMDILVSTNKKFENDFREWQKTTGRKVEIGIEEALTDEQKKGAVGAVDYWIKAKSITDDLLIIAADNYFEMDIRDLISKFNSRDPLVVVYDIGDKEKACEIGKRCQLGLVITEGDRVVRFDEKPLTATSSIISTGIYIFPACLFPVLQQYCRDGRKDNLGSLISYLLENNIVRAYPLKGKWLDIGDEILKGRLPV